MNPFYKKVKKGNEEQKSFKYKGKHYMSLETFKVLEEEISNQMETTKRRSVDDDASLIKPKKMSAEEGARFLRSASLEGFSHNERRALYGTLPFMAAFGMQHKEKAIREVLVTASNLDKDPEAIKEALKTDMDEIIVTVPMMLAALVAIVCQFLVGYNTSVMNSSEPVVFPGHSTVVWSLAVSAFAIGGPSGAIIGGVLANTRGRKGALMICCYSFFLGGSIFTFAQSDVWLIAARLIIGFASGLSSVVVPIYLGEIAPPTLRGTLGTLTQFAIVIGILVADVFAFPLATVSRWRYLFSVTPLLCVFQFFVSPFLLESPRWLLNKDENSVEARVVIRNLRGYRSEEEVENEVSNFLYASSRHKMNRTSAHSSGAMWDLLKDRNQRLLVQAAILLQMAQQLCGINAVFYYSTDFFEGIIPNPLLGTTLVAFINVLATYVALKVMDHAGRRTLLITSAGGMLVSAVFITFALLAYIPKYVALLAVMGFVSFFEIGLGPIPWLIVAEMFDSKYVATAMSLSCIVNWSCNFFVGQFFPFMSEYLGAWSFAPFGGVLVITIAYVFLVLPETLGKTVEEIQRLVTVSDPEYLSRISTSRGADDEEEAGRTNEKQGYKQQGYQVTTAEDVFTKP